MPDMTDYTAKFDAGMERIGEWSLTSQFPDFKGDRAEADALARAAVQTLFVTGMLGDLPLEAQVHPAMQSRVLAAVPTMDEAADRMTAFLQSRSQEDLDHVHRVLGESDAGPRIAQALDEGAALSGVSDARRVQLRKMLAQVEWRMRNQPPGLLVDEYLEKATKLTASDVDLEARKQWVTARVGPLLLAAPDSTTKRSLRSRRTSRGLILMGIGAVMFGLGAALASGDGSDTSVGTGLIAGTVGAVLLLIGLITLLVAAGTPKDA